MASSSTTTAAASTRGEFERQRGELLKEIAESFEHVLANINKLNRNLEAVITVGNEFSSVEALWSTFENVMGKDDETEEGAHEHNADGRERKSGGRDEGHEEEGEGEVKAES
ncbi:unnamed protein product [Discula destructiva]